MILLISLIIISAVFLFFFWKIFIGPLFAYESKLTHNIREELFPTFMDVDKTIITIASAAIVLTIQFLKDPAIIAKEYLISSWIGFSLSIMVGVLILFACYTHRLVDKVMINQVKNVRDEKDKMKKKLISKDALSTIDHHAKLTRILFALNYFVAVFLFISFVTLVVFGIKNALK